MKEDSIYKPNEKHGYLAVDAGNPEEFRVEETGEYLKKISGMIHRISENSEEQFLEIGGKLQSFLSSSRQFAKMSSEVADSISGAILNEGIYEINALIKQFSQKLSESAVEIKSDETELLRILSDVLNILEGMEGFRKIVKHLRMLGISTKIESARLGDEDKGFNTLAEHVEKLSNQINEKVALIASKASFLQTEINKTTRQLNRLEKDQESQAAQILSSTGSTLGKFEEKYNECSVKAAEISQNSSDLSKNIGDIVTAIQFHDITRQQMEHVNEAVSDAAGKSLLINSPCSEDERKEAFEFIHDICELQAIQFESSITEFVEAVENIVSSLRGVEENVSGIFSSTAGLATSSGSSSGSLLGNVKIELLAVLEGLKKNDAISSELSVSIKQVIEIVEDLAKFVLEIEEIGTEIEIIAINARIKAAHTGLNGLALGVLAQEIQKLSIDAKRQTVNVTDILNSINLISQKLKSGGDKTNATEEDTSASATNRKIISLISLMIELEGKAKNDIDKLSGDVNLLKKEIGRAADEFTIHHTNRQTADEITGMLRMITSELSRYFDVRGSKSQHVASLMAKYTMDSERMIHKNFASGRKEIENNTSDEKIFSEDDLGDNVDLF
jgi:methyl-accepting chemotaxis protein